MVPGDKVVVDRRPLTRYQCFGDDAAAFNPLRAVQGRISPAGMSFGGGMHVCLGMNLVAGTVLRDEVTQTDNHQFGTIALIIKELIERGMRPNPPGAAKNRSLSVTSGPSIQCFLIP